MHLLVAPLAVGATIAHSVAAGGLLVLPKDHEYQIDPGLLKIGLDLWSFPAITICPTDTAIDYDKLVYAIPPRLFSDKDMPRYKERVARNIV